MSDINKRSLVDRYYTWEKLVLVTSLLLFFWKIFGLIDTTTVPLLNAVLHDPKKFPHATSVILAIELFILWVEWRQSDENARNAIFNQIRFYVIFAVAFFAVWINVAALTKGTALEGVSRLWFVFYFVIGLTIGMLIFTLIDVTLMIRSKEEGGNSPLARIPVATRCVYMGCWPLVMALLILSYKVSCHAPFAILKVAPFFTALPIFVILVGEIKSYFFIYDDGERVPFRQNISNRRRIFKTHDYLYFLNGRGRQLAQKAKEILPPNATPQEHQKALRQHFSKDSDNVILVAEALEVFDFIGYPKDGNPNNNNPNNLGVRIALQNQKAVGLRVKVWPKNENPPKSIREMTLKVILLEKHANNFVQNNLGKPITGQAFFSYAVDNSVLDTIMEEACAGFPLQDAAFAGRQDLIEQFLAKGKNINEQAGNGWTPLLAAVAQGQSKMVKFMLERGANPDIVNLQKITPLMYAARYGNLEIAKVLIDFGATLDLQDIYGETALAVAVRMGQESLVRLLISKGAKINTRSTLEKLSPLDLAHELGHGNIARLLRKAGAK